MNIFRAFMITNSVLKIVSRSFATSRSASRGKRILNGNSFLIKTQPCFSTKFPSREHSQYPSNIVTILNVMNNEQINLLRFLKFSLSSYLIACNIMAEGLEPFYVLQNYGTNRNCTLSASFPAVVSIDGIDVGGNKGNVNYDVRISS